MKTIVTKFGGSSLSCAAQIKKAAAIIKADPSRRIVVASAPGKRNSTDTKITDMLYRCYDLATAGSQFMPILEQIKTRFAEIITELGVELDINKEIGIIRTHLENKPKRDYMASRGEYLNSRILAAYLGFAFFDAANYVHFSIDGKFEDAQTNANLHEVLSGNIYAVLPGFYGADAEGTIHTFSRGGSDLTGSLAARAVNAELYENWTDVSGMLFSDPRIVEKPKTIDTITYRELRELSYMGASVLHEEAVFPVRNAAIPINIRNTDRPEDKGTMIVPSYPEGHKINTVSGIAGQIGFTSIRIEKSMMNNEIGFGAKLLKIFSDQGLPFEHCPSGIDTMSVIVKSAQFKEKRDIVLQQIRSQLQPEFIEVEQGIALIAVVGCGMIYTKGTALRVFRALAEASINVRMIDQGSSELNIIIGVDEADFPAALRSLCAEFSCHF